MKILKIFGIVVGIHFFALILIFANPGCSTTKPSTGTGAANPATAASPIVPAPNVETAATPAPLEPSSGSSAITFNPDAPASAAPASTDTGVRFTPTRPGTPVAGALQSGPVADVTPATSYTVRSGDNLWTIARKNSITVAQLTTANRLSANATLRPGQKLVIPAKSNAATASASIPLPGSARAAESQMTRTVNSAGADAVKHVVKSGETLGAIARRYGVRQGDLAVANNISDPARIRPGMELLIPGWKAPAAKSGTTSSGASTVDTPIAPASVDPLLPAPSPSTPPPVPVIQIDESPAPKQL